MKKLFLLALAGALSFSMIACGSDEPEEEVVDEEQTEETTNEEQSDILEVPVTVVNSTGVEIHALYLSGANLDQWGDNLIEGTTLADGEEKDLVLYVDKTSLQWDLRVEDSDGVAIQWQAIDISEMSTNGFVMELLWDGEQGTCNLNNYE